MLSKQKRTRSRYRNFSSKNFVEKISTQNHLPTNNLPTIIYCKTDNNINLRRKEIFARPLATTWLINEPSKTVLTTGKLVSNHLSYAQTCPEHTPYPKFNFFVASREKIQQILKQVGDKKDRNGDTTYCYTDAGLTGNETTCKESADQYCENIGLERPSKPYRDCRSACLGNCMAGNDCTFTADDAE